MTDKERMAIAILKTGGSWEDAMRQTGFTMEQLQKLWAEAVASVGIKAKK